MIWFKAEGIAYSSILILLLNYSNQLSKKIKIYTNIFFVSVVIFKIVIYKFSGITLLDNAAHPYYLEYVSDLNLEFIIYKLKLIVPYFFYYGITNIFFI